MSTLNVKGKNCPHREENWVVRSGAYAPCWCFTVQLLIRKEQSNLGISLGLWGV